MLRKKENQAILQTDERALPRFFDPHVTFQVQNRLHIHRSWRTTTRPSIASEPKQQSQSTELSITSWNLDTLNHGKLERFLTDFDADVIIFQGTRFRMRTIPKGKARDGTTTPVRLEWCSRGYHNFSWSWSSGEFSNHACGVLTTIQEAIFGAGQIVQRYDPPRSLAGRTGGIRVKKLASTQRSHNSRRVRTTGKWTFRAQRAPLGSRHKDNGKASETHVGHFWRRLQRGPHARR